ncbi:MAG: potassium transporter TrkG [Pseudomonadota bacterium]
MPAFVALLFVAAAAMLPPAAVASASDHDSVAQAFLYSALMIATLAGFAAIAGQSFRRAKGAADFLMGLLAAYIFLPVVLALPVAGALRDTSFINAYFEMLSAFTTTGASYYLPERLVPSIHLWRGIVGWLGGLLTWVTAMAILAPLDLGGFEVSSEARLQADGQTAPIIGEGVRPVERVRRAVRQLAPIYAFLTGLLWLALVITGAAPLPASVQAMATMSTSGIALPGHAAGGRVAEAFIALFLIFALTRRAFLPGDAAGYLGRIRRDREVRLALFALVIVTTLVFLRHWLGALEVDRLGNPGLALRALWGNLFTALSFLTTTGFVSADWDAARTWSGLPTPGLVLIGLCLMGGGVATTAGGIKLLRVYALYKHSARELGKLVHPHSVAASGRLGRRIRREGAYIAWIFFMLFVVALAACMAALGVVGIDFEAAMVLSISALTTTGPLAEAALADPIIYADLALGPRIVLSCAMIVGRLELLVLLALINPSFWRN